MLILSANATPTQVKGWVAITITTVFSVAIYFYGVVAWKNTLHGTDAEVAHGSRIYFLCYESAFYAGTLVGCIIAKSLIAKVCTRALNSLCAVVLYEELRYGDKQWESWTYWLPVIVLINYFVMYAIIDKMKQHGR